MIAHYREPFFRYFVDKYNCDIFTYEPKESSTNNNFSISSIKTTQLKSKLLFSKLRIFNFLPLLHPKYKVIVLIGEMKVLPVWMILIFAKLMGKKTILWGHGISIYKYLEEEKKLNPIRVLFHKLADHIWLYTDHEKKIWSKYINPARITSVNNTIDIENILNQPILDKHELKIKYNIKTKINFIFCARFSLHARRTDLLLELIKSLDPEKYGFIIIGDGHLKPDFSPYNNVYDFGTVYDVERKNELFQIADLYIQPGWIGLSCNEALAYGKPVLTFERSETVPQCVEYGYLNEQNSYIAKDLHQMLKFINQLTEDNIFTLQQSSKWYATENLHMNTMTFQAENSLLNLIRKEDV